MAILSDTANSTNPAERSLDDYYTQNPGTSEAAAPTPVESGTAVATGYDASTGSLDPTKTASGQMNEITSQDSPLMQRARQEGVLTAARRGLQNSSIAAGTAQGAMVDRAMPLAQQDASMYQNQQIENQRATNRADEVSTGRETEVGLSNTRSAEELEKFNAGLESDVNRFNAAESNQMTRDVVAENAKVNLQGLTGNQAMDLQVLESGTKAAIAENQTAASLYSSYTNAVSSLFMNTSLTPDRMASLVTGLKNTLEGGASFISGMTSLDLSGAFISPPGSVSNTGYSTPVIKQ